MYPKEGQLPQPEERETVTVIHPQYPWKDWALAYNAFLRHPAGEDEYTGTLNGYVTVQPFPKGELVGCIPIRIPKPGNPTKTVSLISVAFGRRNVEKLLDMVRSENNQIRYKGIIHNRKEPGKERNQSTKTEILMTQILGS